ncbi:YHS domain-containing (seleno)protein [Roseicyclus amphidinii]|uniref:YHS domain-containing (seleno)protein n=1 Tax=Roseicyclus amphidinii TaxID=3034232 RepID=UPI0024E0E20C|nr:YHS domain-containing (seleno)protein [Roseicyclus sp. Amp-Y-6]
MIHRRHILSAAALVPLALALPRSARAAEPRVFQGDRGAINGIDPVAYFDGNGPVPGNPDITHDHDGATWVFASAGNREAFAAEPLRFAPAFGGYCAFAASRGYLAPTIPEAWSIHEGRLFLNASLRARRLWTAELPDVIAQGEANWPGILG